VEDCLRCTGLSSRCDSGLSSGVWTVNSEASSTSPSSSAPDKSFLSSSAPVDCFMEFDEDDVADDVYMKVRVCVCVPGPWFSPC